MLFYLAASLAHRGAAVSEAGDDQKSVQRREDSAEAGRVTRGAPPLLHSVPDRQAVGEI